MELRNARLKKLEHLRLEGIDPYPAKTDFTISKISEILESFKKIAPKKKALGLAGRVMAKRKHGGSAFCDIFDGTGNLPAGKAGLQVFFGKDKMGQKQYELFLSAADIGDFVAVWGKPFYTKRKEPTIEVLKWQMLAKSILPLPEKWHGLQDIEERFRKRYLDILMNADIRKTLELRSKIVKEVRYLLDENDFIEAETPILQPLYGGALALPFKTHHRMLDMDMYLRIAPELYLKRLLVAGLPKVYELGKNFRNEGIDLTHNPEFTTVELYAAYWDADKLKKFISDLLSALVKKINKASSLKFNGRKINFPKNIPSISFWSVLERHAMIINPERMPRNDLALKAKQFGLDPEAHESKEKIANEIYSKICRPKMIQPVFLTGQPLAISPLAKSHQKNPNLADRFQLIAGGIELVNGFSELNDPLEQRKRMEAQEKMREAGEKEAEPLDEDFIEALEYGMPPAAGLAVSIDRLTMLLSDTRNIKEVILFPTMKPRV